MLEFIFQGENTAFITAFLIVVGLGLLEGIGLLIGISAMSLLDDLFNFETSPEPTLNLEGGATAILGWLCLDKLPVLVWMVLFLTSFTISGLSLNFVSGLTLGSLLAPIVSIPLAFVGALAGMNKFGNALAKIIPKNESSAIGQDSFSGRLATITVGTAKLGQPAEAMFKDNYNQKHYVMVEPMKAEDTFSQGEQVVLIDKAESFWKATKYKIES